mgnify:CR=1 FL=1
MIISSINALLENPRVVACVIAPMLDKYVPIAINFLREHKKTALLSGLACIIGGTTAIYAVPKVIALWRKRNTSGPRVKYQEKQMVEPKKFGTPAELQCELYFHACPTMPRDAAISILGYLHDKDLASMRLVSRKWNACILDSDTLKHRVERRMLLHVRKENAFCVYWGDNLLSGIASKERAFDIPTAITTARAIYDIKIKNNALYFIGLDLLKQDFSAVKALAKSMEEDSGYSKDLLLHKILKIELKKNDVKGAIDTAGEFESRTLRDDGRRSIIDKIALSNLVSLKEVLSTFENPWMRDAYLVIMIKKNAHNHIDAAKEVASFIDCLILRAIALIEIEKAASR